MAIFEKDVLYVGTVHPPGLSEPILFTDEDIQYYGRRMKEMLADGLQIPLAWSHQDRAKPMTQEEWDRRKAELEKLTLGHACAADVDPELGCLKVKIEIPVEEDARRVRAVRYVSPEIIWNYRDGRGKVWPGPSITHLAVTARPVQHHQQPFRQVALSMLRLSMSDYVRLGDIDVADEPQNTPNNGDGAVDSGAKLKKVLEALAKVGLVLADDTTVDNLLDRLHSVALTKEAADNGSISSDDDESRTTPSEKEISPVMMSLVQKELEPYKQALLRTHRASLQSRIRRLLDTGRITRPIYQALAADCGKVHLSLDGMGDLIPSPLTAKIEAYEALDENSSWPATVRLGQETETDPPDGTDGGQDADRIINEIATYNWKTRRQ